MVEMVNGVYLSSVISVLGIVGNVLNMAVFVKFGLQSTINISFTMLAFSDLASMVTLLWYNVCGSPEFMTSGVPFIFAEVKHLTAGFPHACFSRVTSWVTVYITAERFLCVAFPLKIKRMITPRKAAGVIFVIYAVMILSLLPEYSTVYLTWMFYPSLNKTLLGLAFTNNREDFDGVSLLLYAAFMIASFFGITGFTIALLVVFKDQ
ncbi:growth hormone secretagogue receptor type 1-like [Physella acuta]|uniref:growth hormone secretagogue receptor type 1-like n=1 Tax=Physella acuta TaxID=109671 RepID=UPI0027DDBA89|nr:growth hormone secretagogue receptor type 1-like [Physella acuta]